MLSTLIFALSAVAVSAAPIQPRSTELLLPNATQTGVDAVWYRMNGNNGACGHSDSDSDKVVGLPLEFYTDLSSVSPYCGQYVVVTNPNNNVSVTARVADASTLNNTLSLSVASWEALKDDSLHLVNWRRANETEVALAKKVSSAPSPTNTYVAPSHTAPASKEWKSPSSSSSSVESYSSSPVQHSSSSAVHSSSTWTPSSSAVHSSSTWAPSSSSSEDEKKTYESSKSSSEWVAPSSSSHVASSTSTWTPPSSSSVAQNQRQAAPSSSSYVEEKKTSSTKAWVAPTTTWAPKTTTTSQYVAPKTTTQAQSSGGGGGWSGQATFYNQGGNPGSCGSYASDSDYVVAVNAAQMNSGWCGRTVTISSGGRTISARVADTCPGCSHGSLDLSIAAFGALGSYDQGVLPISWHF